MAPVHPEPKEISAKVTWPNHYAGSNKDLYSLFILKYGIEAWETHAIMECIQYLWRCQSKGTFREDIEKVVVICQRILVEHSQKL